MTCYFVGCSSHCVLTIIIIIIIILNAAFVEIVEECRLECFVVVVMSCSTSRCRSSCSGPIILIFCCSACVSGGAFIMMMAMSFTL